MKFIHQIMTSSNPARTCEDMDDIILKIAEVKALASGNPLIKEQVDLTNQIAKLKILKSEHLSQRYFLERKLHHVLPEKIKNLKELNKDFEKDIKILKSNTTSDKFKITLNNQTFTDKFEAGKYLFTIIQNSPSGHASNIGKYKGFNLSIDVSDIGDTIHLNLTGRAAHTIELGTDALGNIIRMGNKLNSMVDTLEKNIAMLHKLENELEKTKVEASVPFEKEDELIALQVRLDEVNHELQFDKEDNVIQANNDDISREEQENNRDINLEVR